MCQDKYPDMHKKGIAIGGEHSSEGNIQVTVTVVTYNPSWEKLKRTLCSILLQKNIKIQIILADDGSEINYFEDVVKLFIRFNFREYILLPSSENKGTCENIYRTMAFTRGEFIKPISPGDYLFDENTLAEFYRFSKENNADVCFGDVIYYSDDSRGFKCYKILSQPRNLKIYCTKYRNEEQRKRVLKLNYLVLHDFTCGAATFVRAELCAQYLKRIVGKVKYAEDYIYRLMVLDGIIMYYYNRNIIWYEYGTGISTQKNEKWDGLINKDIDSVNDIILQMKVTKDFFSFKYKFLLKPGTKRMTKYLLFPEAFFYALYRRILPHYTEVLCKTEFYEKIEGFYGGMK